MEAKNKGIFSSLGSPILKPKKWKSKSAGQIKKGVKEAIKNLKKKSAGGN